MTTEKFIDDLMPVLSKERNILQLFFLGGLKRYLKEGLYFSCEPLFISYGKERENTM